MATPVPTEPFQDFPMKSPPSTSFMPGNFTAPSDSDDFGVPFAEGIMGVINAEVTGPSKVGGQGSSPGAPHMPNAAEPGSMAT